MNNLLNKIILLVVILVVVTVAIVAVTSNRSVSDHPADILNSSQNATSTDFKGGAGNENRTASNGRVRSTEEGTLNMRETKEIAGVKITLNSLVQEYRCGIGASCSESGGVVVNVTFDNGNKKETRNFASDEASYQFDGYAISITKITPSKFTGKEIKESEYQITFKVEPLAGRNPASNI